MVMFVVDRFTIPVLEYWDSRKEIASVYRGVVSLHFLNGILVPNCNEATVDSMSACVVRFLLLSSLISTLSAYIGEEEESARELFLAPNSVTPGQADSARAQNTSLCTCMVTRHCRRDRIVLKFSLVQVLDTALCLPSRRGSKII